MIFSTLTDVAIEALDRDQAALRALAQPLLTHFYLPLAVIDAETSKAALEKLLPVEIYNMPTLYQIDLKGDNATPALLDAFDLGRKIIAHRRYSRRHGHLKTTLYVGRSNKIVTRLNEHLGFGHDKTYALNLKWWASTRIDEVVVACASYPKGTSAGVMGHLEDALAAVAHPMFGRRGSV